jgi:hypothetical protein
VDEYPSNSHKSRTAPKAEVKVQPETDEKKDRPEKVATGKVRKKSHTARLKEAMFGEETIKSVLENVLYEVMIPAAKELVVDSMIETVSRKFGTNVGRKISRSVAAHSSGPVAYNAFSRMGGRPTPAAAPAITRARTGRYEVEDILFETRQEAASVMQEMYQRLARYGAVSVMDYYDLVGQTGNHVDEKWGWTSFSNSGVASVGRDGYVINLPTAEPLD